MKLLELYSNVLFIRVEVCNIRSMYAASIILRMQPHSTCTVNVLWPNVMHAVPVTNNIISVIHVTVGKESDGE